MKTKTTKTTDIVLIEFSKFDGSILDIEISAYTDDTYLSERDGTSATEFAPAFNNVLPKDVEWDSMRSEAWVAHWDTEIIDKFDGKSFKVTRHQTREVDGDGELLDQIGDDKFEIEEIK